MYSRNIVIWLFGFSVASLAASQGNGAEPPKPVHQFELPFADGKSKVLDGWVGFSPKGNRLAAYYTLGEKSYIAIWDPVSGKLLDKFQVALGVTTTSHGPPANFASDGSYLGYLTRDELCFHPLVPDLKPQVKSFVNPTKALDPVHDSLFFSSDGKVVKILKYSVSDERLCLWEGRVAFPIQFKSIENRLLSRARRFALSSDLGLIACAQVPDPSTEGDQPRTIHLLKIGAMGRKLTTAKASNDFSALAFSTDSKFLASGSIDGSLVLWDIQKGSERFIIPLPVKGCSVSTIAFNPAGSWLAYGSLDRNTLPNVRLFSLKTGKVEQAWADNTWATICLCYSPSGQYLAVLGGTGVNVYDLGERQQ